MCEVSEKFVSKCQTLMLCVDFVFAQSLWHIADHCSDFGTFNPRTPDYCWTVWHPSALQGALPTSSDSAAFCKTAFCFRNPAMLFAFKHYDALKKDGLQEEKKKTRKIPSNSVTFTNVDDVGFTFWTSL